MTESFEVNLRMVNKQLKSIVVSGELGQKGGLQKKEHLPDSTSVSSR